MQQADGGRGAANFWKAQFPAPQETLPVGGAATGHCSQVPTLTTTLGRLRGRLEEVSGANLTFESPQPPQLEQPEAANRDAYS
jgi:hypothetical protein